MTLYSSGITPLAIVVGRIDGKAVLSAGWRLRSRVLLESAVHQLCFQSACRGGDRRADAGSGRADLEPCYKQSRGGCESGTRDYQKGPVWRDAVLIAPVTGCINRFCAIRVQVTQAGRHLIAKVQLLVPAAETTDHLHIPPSDGPNQELA